MAKSDENDLADRMFASLADEIRADIATKTNCPTYQLEMAEKRRKARLDYENYQRTVARDWAAAEFGAEFLLPEEDGGPAYRHAAE